MVLEFAVWAFGFYMVVFFHFSEARVCIMVTGAKSSSGISFAIVFMVSKALALAAAQGFRRLLSSFIFLRGLVL